VCKITHERVYTVGMGKKWSNFGTDLNPDVDLGSLFHFPTIYADSQECATELLSDTAKSAVAEVALSEHI